jgi:hypothetical protein
LFKKQPAENGSPLVVFIRPSAVLAVRAVQHLDVVQIGLPLVQMRHWLSGLQPQNHGRE